MLKSIFSLLSLALAVAGNMAPSEPDSTTVAKPGQPLLISWGDDGKAPPIAQQWTSFTIGFMTGDNLGQILLATVASKLDATKQSSFTWTTPVVDTPAKIYFFMFTSDVAGASPAWTTRFTITGPDGVTTVAAPNATQPDGSPTPWGAGHLIPGGAATGSLPASASAMANVTSAAANATSAANSTVSAATGTSASPGNAANTATSTGNSSTPSTTTTHSGAGKTSAAVVTIALMAGLISLLL